MAKGYLDIISQLIDSHSGSSRAEQTAGLLFDVCNASRLSKQEFLAAAKAAAIPLHGYRRASRSRPRRRPTSQGIIHLLQNATSEYFNPPCGGLNLSHFEIVEEDYVHRAITKRGVFMAGRKVRHVAHLILSRPGRKVGHVAYLILSTPDRKVRNVAHFHNQSWSVTYCHRLYGYRKPLIKVTVLSQCHPPNL